MEILFTKNNSPVSRLIRYITKEPVSHCAIRSDKWVIHANFLGVHVELYDVFVATSTAVYSVKVPATEDSVYNALYQKEGSFYDFGAMLYLGLEFIFPFLPHKNLWQSNGAFLCTEWVTFVLDGEIDSNLTAYGLYLKLKEKYEPDTSQNSNVDASQAG